MARCFPEAKMLPDIDLVLLPFLDSLIHVISMKLKKSVPLFAGPVFLYLALLAFSGELSL